MYLLQHFPLIFVVFFGLFYGTTINAANQSCSKENNSCAREETNKYSKESNTKYLKYINKIEEAKSRYKPCNNKNCNCYMPVIKHDLKPFKEAVSKEDIERVQSKGTKYQIINHKLYREKNCMFPSRCQGIEHFLLKLAPKLSDTELIINTRDWPQIHKNYGTKGPVFSFSKTAEYQDIMYPAWAFWEGGPAISLYPKGIGRWDVLREKLGKLGNLTLWQNKVSKAFFRGSRTSSERDPLVLLSRERPDLVDAQYTKNQAWKSDADTLHAPPAKEVPFEDHCNFKYLFNFRGVAASFRFKHILLCKSLVFHVGNEWKEFFYDSLKPWIHYIPVEAKATKRELEVLLEFAEENEELAKEIAENGYEFIWNNLRMKDVECYWKRLLDEYGKLLKFEVVRDENLVEVRG
ncbi:O-glucosyltransferase rumi homolog [Anthonomus grandis grandis]|uniref:O-glucosyltransferase rumi homolog n=1 Tax=Anthonomus grandis grandis TaxID=2921223 RepID=UPI0021657890|nr:O-glucosyltransferase rumi homolog [Anthonomus grandis grandis]